MTRRAHGPVLVITVLLGAAACAETTVEPAATAVSGSASASTTFIPHGTTVELLDQMAAETGELSDLIIAGDGEDEALGRIEARWAQVEPVVEDERPELDQGFDTVMDLLRTAVERRRPADADKAHNNLLVLIRAYR